jgi:hypothetical protein
MFKYISSLILLVIAMPLVARDAHAQQRLLVAKSVCADDEFQVRGSDVLEVAPSLFYRIPRETQNCKFTYSFESATSEPDPQLLILSYFVQVEEFAPPTSCEFQDGPVLTEVRSGLDETHTIISEVLLDPITTNQVFHRRILPCVQSAFGGQFRLHRRCLAVECYSTEP